VVSGQTTVVVSGWATTARWLPSITSSPLNEPTMESNGWSEMTVLAKDFPPSDEEARTTSARTSSGSRLRS